MDTGEAPGHDDPDAQIPRRHRRVLAAASFAIVLVTDDDRSDTLRPVVSGNLGDVQPRLTRQYVRPLSGFPRERIVGPKKHIVTDLVQMASVLEPRPSRGDMIRRRLAFGLDQHRQLLEIFSVPAVEGLQKLEPLAAGRNINL